MEYVKDYPFEFTKPLELCFRMLGYCNIIFFDDDIAPLKKYSRNIMLIPCAILHFASLTFFVVNIVIGNKKAVDLASTVPIYMVTIQAILKVIVLVTNKKEIQNIIKQLGSSWRVTNLTEVQIQRKNCVLKRLDFCQKAYFYSNIIGSWMYSLSPIAEVLIKTFILHQKIEWLFPYRCEYPFDPTVSWPLYLFVYALQIYSMFHYIYAYLGMEFIMVALCAHLVTEFTLLREDLLHIKPIPNDRSEEVVDEIKEFVKKHQKLTLLSQQLDIIFNKINFVILLFATVITCFFAFAAKVTDGSLIMFVNCIAVPGMLVPVFILCYYSQLLAIESAGIADSAYNSQWYKGGIHHQKCIYFIIMRSQRPCSLTSMQYSPITLNTFSKVLSTTWSYFSLISRVYEEGYDT